ncbi:MAG: type II toxin-antitoxin system Phd/YefM family antitoxin [Acidobacteria bacterium]|nr:type II toxin-antitoxin system Phd/YefM family antitoxin [Acidobacteriota bacterium]MBI3655717.1 type II toxin-antitoxin system Phd/YefM family antitoxin [Acidobacteriota bacterium]
MLDISKDIHSLSDFKRNTTDFIRQMKKNGHPVVLTINGKAELVVQDATSYQQLLELVDRLEAIEGIKHGIDAVKAGRTEPLEKVFAGIRRRKR